MEDYYRTPGAFIAGFDYNWYDDKKLADLVEEYHTYALSMDEAIGSESQREIYQSIDYRIPPFRPHQGD